MSDHLTPTVCPECGVRSDGVPPHRIQYPRCPTVMGRPPRFRLLRKSNGSSAGEGGQ